MSASHRLAALALAAACLAPAGANAMDDFVRAIGSRPTELVLCGDGDAPLKSAACKAGGFDMLPAQIDKAFAVRAEPNGWQRDEIVIENVPTSGSPANGSKRPRRWAIPRRSKI
jgi:hypothetical protein